MEVTYTQDKSHQAHHFSRYLHGEYRHIYGMNNKKTIFRLSITLTLICSKHLLVASGVKQACLVEVMREVHL